MPAISILRVKSIKMMIQVTLMILAFTSVTVFGCEDRPLPDGSRCPSTGLYLFPDPDHCSRYWECYNGCLSHMMCQLDYLFDPEKGWCNYAGDVCCGQRDCDGRTCNENCSGESTTANPDFTCPEKYGYYADPDNCAKYYQCYNGQAIHHTCQVVQGKQLHYNSEDVQCDWPERVDCGNRPICQDVANDMNCDIKTTTESSINCNAIPCTNGDGFYPLGSCQNCFCRCVGNDHYQYCCQPGLVFNPILDACDWPTNVAGC